MLVLLVLAALVTAGSSLRRVFGLALALPMFALPFQAESTMARAILAGAAFWGFARLIDLAREPRPLSPLHRAAHVLAVVDSRRVSFTAPHLDLRAFGRVALAAAAAYLALWTAHVHAPDGGPLRWLAGVVFMYGFAECLAGSLHAVGALIGAQIPPIHRHPILARSLRDFWGERWNLPVNRWLRQHCFMPLARRGRAGLGLTLAFAVSVLLHAWIVAVALDAEMVARTALFFALQGALLSAEGPLGVARWSQPLARAWTLAGTILPSPLFTEPMLRMFAELVV